MKTVGARAPCPVISRAVSACATDRMMPVGVAAEQPAMYSHRCVHDTMHVHVHVGKAFCLSFREEVYIDEMDTDTR